MKKCVPTMTALLVLFTAQWGISQTWNIQTVDNSGDVGHWSDVAYDSQGYPHICYYNATRYSLMYARWNGEGWDIEEIGAGLSSSTWGQYCSIAIDQSDKPHIAFSRYNTFQLTYATKDAQGQWQVTTAGSSSGYYGKYTSIVLTYGYGKVIPNIAHYNYFFNNLYYTYRDPQTDAWVNVPVDQGSDVGMWTDIAADAAGKLYISYYDAADKDLKFAYFNLTEWSNIIVDGLDSDVGQMTSIVVDAGGLVHITYYDETNADLKHATVTPGS